MNANGEQTKVEHPSYNVWAFLGTKFLSPDDLHSPGGEDSNLRPSPHLSDALPTELPPVMAAVDANTREGLGEPLNTHCRLFFREPESPRYGQELP